MPRIARRLLATSLATAALTVTMFLLVGVLWTVLGGVLAAVTVILVMATVGIIRNPEAAEIAQERIDNYRNDTHRLTRERQKMEQARLLAGPVGYGR